MRVTVTEVAGRRRTTGTTPLDRTGDIRDASNHPLATTRVSTTAATMPISLGSATKARAALTASRCKTFDDRSSLEERSE